MKYFQALIAPWLCFAVVACTSTPPNQDKAYNLVVLTGNEKPDCTGFDNSEPTDTCRVRCDKMVKVSEEDGEPINDCYDTCNP